MKPVIKSLIAALSLGAISTSAVAQDLPFLKQNKPNSLGLFVWVSEDCPFGEDDTIKRAVREFRQANLTATESLALNLTINIDCMSIQNDNDKTLGVSTYMETRWGSQMSNGYNVLYEEPNYGTYMISSPDQPESHYLNKVAESVQDALKDYKKVNF